MREFAEYIYGILKLDCQGMDAIYGDHIKRMFGVYGFNALLVEGFLEGCGSVNGRQLYVLCDKKQIIFQTGIFHQVSVFLLEVKEMYWIIPVILFSTLYLSIGLLCAFIFNEVYSTYYIKDYAVAIVCFWAILLPTIAGIQLYNFVKDTTDKKEDEKR